MKDLGRGEREKKKQNPPATPTASFGVTQSQSIQAAVVYVRVRIGRSLTHHRSRAGSRGVQSPSHFADSESEHELMHVLNLKVFIRQG